MQPALGNPGFVFQERIGIRAEFFGDFGDVHDAFLTINDVSDNYIIPAAGGLALA
jgi:hypothetical protein